VAHPLTPDFLDALRASRADMIDDTRRLVEVESPSSDPIACGAAVAEAVRIFSERVPGTAVIDTPEGRPVLRWGSPTPRVLLLGHLDTVWPHGTLNDIPWSVTTEDRGTVLRGPGVFDMKAGVVQTIYALGHVLGQLPDADVGVLLTTDEEIGSQSSRTAIELSCARADAVFVTEPAVGELFKSARKGTSWYELVVHGRAAHAGLDPATGINSLLAMARLALAVSELGSTAFDTTVTPTLGSAGTTANTVPDHATLSIDVRAWSPDEQNRVDEDIRRIAQDDSLLRGAAVEVKGGPSRPAMPESSSLGLIARLDELCPQLGLTFPGARAVGGASDGNFTAALGVDTLDGLGAVGGGAHAISEWVLADAMPERAAMLAALILDVLSEV